MARKLADRFDDGVAFVALGDIHDPALVAAEIARVLGTLDGYGDEGNDRLVDVLQHRHQLLVLDNFEQSSTPLTLSPSSSRPAPT